MIVFFGGRRLEHSISKILLLSRNLVAILFNRVVHDKTLHCHVFLLADAMAAVDGLLLDLRIPPRIQDDDVVGRREIQTDAHRHLAREKDLDIFLVREGVNQPVSRLQIQRAVDAHECHVGKRFFEGDGDDVKEGRELREDDNFFVGFVVENVLDRVEQHVDLGRRYPVSLAEARDVFLVREVKRLAEDCQRNRDLARGARKANGFIVAIAGVRLEGHMKTLLAEGVAAASDNRIQRLEIAQEADLMLGLLALRQPRVAARLPQQRHHGEDVDEALAGNEAQRALPLRERVVVQQNFLVSEVAADDTVILGRKNEQRLLDALPCHDGRSAQKGRLQGSRDRALQHGILQQQRFVRLEQRKARLADERQERLQILNRVVKRRRGDGPPLDAHQLLDASKSRRPLVSNVVSLVKDDALPAHLEERASGGAVEHLRAHGLLANRRSLSDSLPELEGANGGADNRFVSGDDEVLSFQIDGAHGVRLGRRAVVDERFARALDLIDLGFDLVFPLEHQRRGDDDQRADLRRVKIGRVGVRLLAARRQEGSRSLLPRRVVLSCEGEPLVEFLADHREALVDVFLLGRGVIFDDLSEVALKREDVLRRHRDLGDVHDRGNLQQLLNDGLNLEGLAVRCKRKTVNLLLLLDDCSRDFVAVRTVVSATVRSNVVRVDSRFFTARTFLLLPLLLFLCSSCRTSDQLRIRLSCNTKRQKLDSFSHAEEVGHDTAGVEVLSSRHPSDAFLLIV